jgi:hypothetical protein
MVLVSLAAFVLLALAYSSLFSQKRGYLISLPEGQVFSIGLALDPSLCDPWMTLVPGIGCKGIRVIAEERMGVLDELLARSDVKTKLEKQGKYSELSRIIGAEINATSNDISSGQLQVYELACFTLAQFKASSLTPSLAFLNEAMIKSPDDALVSNCSLWTSTLFSNEGALQVLNGAMILRGSLARVFATKVQ